MGIERWGSANQRGPIARLVGGEVGACHSLHWGGRRGMKARSEFRLEMTD